MTSKASDLIMQAEREAGCRYESNDGDNVAMAKLFGAMARALGSSGHQEHDDVPAGTVIRHMMTPEYKRRQKAEQALAVMLARGISPDDIKAMSDTLHKGKDDD